MPVTDYWLETPLETQHDKWLLIWGEVKNWLPSGHSNLELTSQSGQ